MRNSIVVVLLLISSATSSLAADVKPKDKVILTVNAIVHATAQHSGSDGVGVIKDELNCQLTETVKYKILRNEGKGNIILEMISHKNHMTANGSGSAVSDSGGVETWSKWTYSIPPESSFPNTSIMEIYSGPPYNARISVGDFFRNCNGTASGSEKFVKSWEPGADAPTYEITPINKQSLTYATTTSNCLFESPEDIQLAGQGEMTALSKKITFNLYP